MRIDKFIQQKFNLRSRTYAENLILKGQVLLNGTPVFKPSAEVSESDVTEILSDENFASQGAYKLQKALDEFGIDVSGRNCLDIGCSNGGFTDCLLRRGAAKILAVDVAECALPQNILSDPRVTFLRANARELDINEKFGFICADVSFISLKYILPTVSALLADNGMAVTLIKPQFECGKKALNKKGIVTDEKDRAAAISAVKQYAAESGLSAVAVTQAPVYYADKNVEYLMQFAKNL